MEMIDVIPALCMLWSVGGMATVTTVLFIKASRISEELDRSYESRCLSQKNG